MMYLEKCRSLRMDSFQNRLRNAEVYPWFC